MEKVVRCTQCRTELSMEELEKIAEKNFGKMDNCPTCGTESLPMDIKEDVEIKINWHELRILGMFAENWARHIGKKDESCASSIQTVTAITTAIEKQFPLKTPLMLVREIGQLKEQFPGVKLTDSEGNEIK